jgi:hypothetical protein
MQDKQDEGTIAGGGWCLLRHQGRRPHPSNVYDEEASKALADISGRRLNLLQRSRGWWAPASSHSRKVSWPRIRFHSMVLNVVSGFPHIASSSSNVAALADSKPSYSLRLRSRPPTSGNRLATHGKRWMSERRQTARFLYSSARHFSAWVQSSSRSS